MGGTAGRRGGWPPYDVMMAAVVRPVGVEMARVELKFGNMILDTVELTLERTVVGRGPDAHLRVEDGFVSRAHCALVDSVDGHRIQDLGSSSGTFIDGTKVVDRLLADGDLVVLGRHTLRYRDSRSEVSPGRNPSRQAVAEPTMFASGDEAEDHREIQALVQTQVATPLQVSRMRDALEARQTPRIGWALDDEPRSFVLPNGRGTFVVGFGRGMDARLPGLDSKPREVFMIVAYGHRAEVVPLSDRDEVRVAGRRVRGRRALKYGEVVEAAGVEFRYIPGDTRPPTA